MDIESLKVFLTIVKYKNISKASEILHMSQPALSLKIKRLENESGHKLFTRNNKGVELTKAGLIWEKNAKNIIEIYDLTLNEISKMGSSENIIRVDSNLVLATYALPCHIYKAQSEFKDYFIDLTFSTSESIEKKILHGLSDIGYVYKKIKDQRLSYTKIGEDHLVLVSGKDFMSKSIIDFNELKEYKLIEFYDKFSQIETLETSFKKHGYSYNDINFVFSLDSTESVKTAIYNGFGLSFLPYTSVKKELNSKQLKEIIIKDFHIKYDIYLIYLKENENKDQFKEVIQYLKRKKDKYFC